jgi:hypothetical protein
MHRILPVLLLVLAPLLHAEPKRVALFVALCDNATQGIAPVPAKIGDGNIPAENLYWGCDDGFASCFKASKSWKLKTREPFTAPDAALMERLVYQNSAGTIEVTAEAWRGSHNKDCLRAFETALVSGKDDLCAFIGHNLLMDGPIDPPKTKAAKPCDAIVLCCMSQSYFNQRLTDLGAKPVLLTKQFMYPGAFILRDALPVWSRGGTSAQILDAAAGAYAANQKISRKAAAGVFWVAKQ